MESSMTEVCEVSPRDLFAAKLKAAKDADVAKIAECILEAYREGWIMAANQGGINLGSVQAGRGRIACELLAKVPKYDIFPHTCRLLFAEIVRAWIASCDEKEEVSLSDRFVFARFDGLTELVRKEVDGCGRDTLQKVYRILARLSKLQINHNQPVLAALLELMRVAPPEHLLALGKIFATGAVDAHFVDFRLPKLVCVLDRIAKA
jgi:hypothetical protein